MKKKYGSFAIHFYLAVLVILAYPFSIRISGVLIGLWGLHWLFILFSGSGKKPAWSWLLLLLALPFCYLISLIYSGNWQYGLFSIEKRISLFLMPLIFSTVPGWDRQKRDQFFLFAYFSAVLAAAVCLAVSTYNFMVLGENTFFWIALTKPLTFHPGYFSFFISIVIFWMVFDLIGTWSNRTIVYRSTAITSMVFLSLFLILLASRLQLFLFYFTVVVLGLSYWRKLNIRQLLVVVLFLAGSIYLIANTFILDRIRNISTISYKLDDPPEKFNELTIRLALTECSWEVIKKDWLIGVGVGDSFDELDKVYRQANYRFGYEDRQDPHNEYLNTLVSTGVIGLISLMGIFGLSFYLAIKRKDPVHFTFIAFFAIGCLLESMLSQQKGIVLFSLFNSLLVFQGGPNDLSEVNDPR